MREGEQKNERKKKFKCVQTVGRLGALLRLCGDEECFKEAIGTELDIDDEACGVGTNLGGPRRGVADLNFGWNFFAFGG